MEGMKMKELSIKLKFNTESHEVEKEGVEEDE